MSNWYTETLGDGIAVSTRIRLARNVASMPFPSRMTYEQRCALRSIFNSDEAKALMPDDMKLTFIDMEAVSEIERIAMAERHIISPAFAAEPKGRAVLINDDETISVMIGEEDHLRIQVLLSGLQLGTAFEISQRVDEYLSSVVKYAYDDRLGYLTECPTNLGIGMRASVMLHLPAIEADSSFNSIAENAGKIGLAVRGLYGEGSSSAASLYQISNQITLGITEENAIDNLKVITEQIIDKERAARENLRGIKIEDTVFRALATLKFARLISSDEMLNLLSKVKLGIYLGIITEIDKSVPMKIMIESLPGMLQKKFGVMSAGDRDISRAEFIREQM